MDKLILLEKAIQIAVNAHFGQRDKADKPYIFHPMRVMDKVNTIDEKTVAILHDVLEDTDITPEFLLSEGFPSYIVEAIKNLTKLDNEKYDDFIIRASNNPIAINVKIADIKDNLDVSRLSDITDKDVDRLKRYLKVLDQLHLKP